MRVIRNVVVSPQMDKPNFVMDRVRQDTPVLGVFLICIRMDSANLLEMIHFVEIVKPIYKRNTYVVVGIANGRKDGRLLIAEMIRQFAASGVPFHDFKNYWLGDTRDGRQ